MRVLLLIPTQPADWHESAHERFAGSVGDLSVEVGVIEPEMGLDAYDLVIVVVSTQAATLVDTLSVLPWSQRAVQVWALAGDDLELSSTIRDELRRWGAELVSELTPSPPSAVALAAAVRAGVLDPPVDTAAPDGPRVAVILTVDGELDDEKLRSLGFERSTAPGGLESFGIVAGTISEAALESLRATPGVLAVEPDETVSIAPPESPLQ